MRKKQLVAQNLTLFERVEALNGEIADKNKKIRELETKIKELEDSVKNPVVTTEPLKKLEEKVVRNASLKPDVEYGSKVIGKLVMESANASNSLTAGGNTANRELVNLLLGKTEVAKAEILSIVSAEDDLEIKKEKIDSVKEEALDYFSSILAQIG